MLTKHLVNALSAVPRQPNPVRTLAAEAVFASSKARQDNRDP